MPLPMPLHTSLPSHAARAVLAAVLLVVPGTPRLASAQDGAYTASGVRLEAGPAWSARRDAIVSPLAFAGTGWRLALGHEWRTDRGTRGIVVRAGVLGLRPASAPSSERLVTASMEASALRGGRGLQGGIALRGALAVTRHAFHEAAVAEPVYRLSTLGIGPAVRGSRRVSGGDVTVRLAVPLVGWIDRPYSAIKSGNARFAPRGAGPSTLRAIDAGVAWESRGWRGPRVRVAYDMELVASDLHGALRSVQHGVSVGAHRATRRIAR